MKEQGLEYNPEHYAALLAERFSHVLQELQPYPNFVTWTRTKDNKKIPLNPTTGRAASTIDSATWTPIDQALDELRKGRGISIGFVFAENDSFTGIDIDHCVLKNDLSPQASEIITLLDSYTELSPSHTGLHIIVKGSIPDGRRKDSIEIYSTGRYFTLTTNHLIGTSDTIELRQSQLDILYASLSEYKPVLETPKAPEHQLFVSDEKVLEKAENARNGASFTALYNGNIAGYHSKSEADFVLILRLLYWCNDDIAQVKRIFLQSGLADEKTLRPTNGTDYLSYTVENALKKRRK